ncbi:MAG: TIGR04149 family rSAM-modified RiPP, partial [Alistipes sp.]
MKNLKVNQIEKNRLDAKEMRAITGGAMCGCGCKYANNQGSSTTDNANANMHLGLNPSDAKIHIEIIVG